MAAIAIGLAPHAVCLVPERRAERTTEGGLDVAGNADWIARIVGRLNDTGVRVSLFIAPEPEQVRAAHKVGAPVIELHTGAYAHAAGDPGELRRLRAAATLAAGLGLEVHAGHGLTFDNVASVAALPEIAELNIGHFLVGEAIFIGLAAAIREMRSRIELARIDAAAR